VATTVEVLRTLVGDLKAENTRLREVIADLNLRLERLRAYIDG